MYYCDTGFAISRVELFVDHGTLVDLATLDSTIVLVASVASSLFLSCYTTVSICHACLQNDFETTTTTTTENKRITNYLETANEHSQKEEVQCITIQHEKEFRKSTPIIQN